MQCKVSKILDLLAEIGGSHAAAELLLSALGDATEYEKKTEIIGWLLKTRDQRGARVILEHLFQEVYEEPAIAIGTPRCHEYYSALFGDYTDAIFAIRGYESSRSDRDYITTIWEYSLSEGDKALNMLCSIESPVSSNILHLVTRKKDLTVPVSTANGEVMGTAELSFRSQRERAEAELRRRGSPSYDTQVFLDRHAWNI